MILFCFLVDIRVLVILIFLFLVEWFGIVIRLLFIRFIYFFLCFDFICFFGFICIFLKGDIISRIHLTPLKVAEAIFFYNEFDVLLRF